MGRCNTHASKERLAASLMQQRWPVAATAAHDAPTMRNSHPSETEGSSLEEPDYETSTSGSFLKKGHLNLGGSL